MAQKLSKDDKKAIEKACAKIKSHYLAADKAYKETLELQNRLKALIKASKVMDGWFKSQGNSESDFRVYARDVLDGYGNSPPMLEMIKPDLNGTKKWDKEIKELCRIYVA